MMNLRIVTGVVALFVLTGAARLGAAQEATKTTHKKTRSLTGCLQKGEDANEYNFTTKGGGAWEIKSDSVKLDEHVGHTVKIKGVCKCHSARDEGRREERDARARYRQKCRRARPHDGDGSDHGQ